MDSVNHSLLFTASLEDGFDPRHLPPVLPKNLIHLMVEGERIHQFFADWLMVHRQTIHLRDISPRQHFVAAAQFLSQEFGYSLVMRRKPLWQGFLEWELPPQE